MAGIRAKLAVTAALATAALAGFQLVALPVSAASPPRAKLVLPEATKDFGAVVTGTELAHSFVLRNEGDAPLEIREIRPGMGPISIPHFDATIPPGAAGRLDVTIDALRLAGAGTAKLELLTNDPDQATATLGLAWNVQPVVVAKPDRARWEYVQKETTGTLHHLIWAKDGQPFTVLEVETPDPHLQTSFRPLTAEERDTSLAGSQWRVELTLDSNAPVGPIRGIVVVRTDHPKQRRMPIAVSGFVRPRYILEPQLGRTSRLGILNLAAPTTLTFKLRNFATAPVEVTKVETTLPGVTAKAAPAQLDGKGAPVPQDGHYFDVMVRLDPEAMATGAFAGKVVVGLSDPLQPSVEMPLSGELVLSSPSGH